MASLRSSHPPLKTPESFESLFWAYVCEKTDARSSNVKWCRQQEAELLLMYKRAYARVPKELK